MLKKILLTIAILMVIVLLCELHGYKRGYEQGRKEINAWWIDQKSRLYDTSEVLKKKYDKWSQSNLNVISLSLQKYNPICNSCASLQGNGGVFPQTTQSEEIHLTHMVGFGMSPARNS